MKVTGASDRQAAAEVLLRDETGGPYARVHLLPPIAPKAAVARATRLPQMTKTNDKCSRCDRDRDGKHRYCSTCRSAYHYQRDGRPEVARLVRSLAGVADGR